MDINLYFCYLFLEDLITLRFKVINFVYLLFLKLTAKNIINSTFKSRIKINLLRKNKKFNKFYTKYTIKYLEPLTIFFFKTSNKNFSIKNSATDSSFKNDYLLPITIKNFYAFSHNLFYFFFWLKTRTSYYVNN